MITESLLSGSTEWAGKSILLLAFGVRLIKVLRGDDEVMDAFASLVLGFAALVFYKSLISNCLGVGAELENYIRGLGDDTSVINIIRDGAASVAKATSGFDSRGGGTIDNAANSALNIINSVSQAFRIGVWGVVSKIIEFIYLVAADLLKSARDVLIQLLFFLIPILAGIFPYSERALRNGITFLIELCLWGPFLVLIQIVTGSVAKQYVFSATTGGVNIIPTILSLSVQLSSILLIFSIPSVTHKLVGGSLGGDLETTGPMSFAKRFTGL